MKLPISGRSQNGRRANETKNIRVRNRAASRGQYPPCEALDYVGLIFLFRIDTASVTALTQISASMVVPSSPTIQSLMRRPSRAKKASALNRPVSPSPENIRGVSGATLSRLRAVLKSLN